MRPARFAGACSLVPMVLFAFSKQAFCNYYYLCTGFLAVAVGVSGHRAPAREPGARGPTEG
jgi:hypothetical protein